MLKETAEDMMSREFYEFYKKVRRKQCKKIDQYNYFEKAIGGMLIELKKIMEETNEGVHLRGLGVLYKKPFGEYMVKLSLFTKRMNLRQATQLFLEDDYLRAKYYIKRILNISSKKKQTNPEAVLLHRKLIRKNGSSHT